MSDKAPEAKAEFDSSAAYKALGYDLIASGVWDSNLEKSQTSASCFVCEAKIEAPSRSQMRMKLRDHILQEHGDQVIPCQRKPMCEMLFQAVEPAFMHTHTGEKIAVR